MGRAERIVTEADAARAGDGAGRYVTCPNCGKRVVRWTYAEIRYVQRNGCGCPRSPAARRQRAHALRDRRPLRDTGR